MDIIDVRFVRLDKWQGVYVDGKLAIEDATTICMDELPEDRPMQLRVLVPKEYTVACLTHYVEQNGGLPETWAEVTRLIRPPSYHYDEDDGGEMTRQERLAHRRF